MDSQPDTTPERTCRKIIFGNTIRLSGMSAVGKTSLEVDKHNVVEINQMHNASNTTFEVIVKDGDYLDSIEVYDVTSAWFECERSK